RESPSRGAAEEREETPHPLVPQERRNGKTDDAPRLERLRARAQEFVVGHFTFVFGLHVVDNEFLSVEMRVENLHAQLLAGALEESIRARPAFKCTDFKEILIRVSG